MQRCKKLMHTQITSALRNKSQEILGNSLRYIKVKHIPNLWDVVRTVLGGKFRMVNIKEGRHQVKKKTHKFTPGIFWNVKIGTKTENIKNQQT